MIKMKEMEESEEFINREPEIVKKYYRISIKPLFHDTSKSARLDLTMLEKLQRIKVL